MVSLNFIGRWNHIENLDEFFIRISFQQFYDVFNVNSYIIILSIIMYNLSIFYFKGQNVLFAWSILEHGVLLISQTQAIKEYARMFLSPIFSMNHKKYNLVTKFASCNELKLLGWLIMM